jgi:hypothetical protein
MSNVNLEQQTRESVTTLELFQYRGGKKEKYDVAARPFS